ncbi:MAG: endonuclease/exonuclease/phosphatase family protein, partial [Burkholderiaceae bacterium]
MIPNPSTQALRVASWNVNSLRVRLPHVLAWLADAQPDLLGLQETKLVDDKFPRAEIEAAGYAVHYTGQPTYNGVAILAKQSRFSEISDVMHHDPRLPDDQRRLTALTAKDVGTGLDMRFICVYVPNGSEVGSDKYRYKLAWLDTLE